MATKPRSVKFEAVVAVHALLAPVGDGEDIDVTLIGDGDGDGIGVVIELEAAVAGFVVLVL